MGKGKFKWSGMIMIRSRGRTIKGFTLIELLVVMAIISLLAGIMVPVIGKAKRAAKKNYIRSQANQLKSAWELSFLELKRLPEEPWETMELDAVRYLHGNNAKGYIFMDFGTNHLNSADGMLDKYDSKPYYIALDDGVCINDDAMAYNGIVKYAELSLETHVGVWHDWKKAGDPRDDLRSWKEN